MIKRKQKEQKLGIHELLYKRGVGSGAPGKPNMSYAQHPSWNPKSHILVNVNPRRGQLIFVLPVTGP